jgi:predicted dehydrogenase
MNDKLANPVISQLGHRLRLGVVGGGPGSTIGEVHRIAARLDDHYEIVASVLSSDPDRSRAVGSVLGIPSGRAYGTVDEMLEREVPRDDGIEVMAVMTPNNGHYAACRAALDHGLDVICDKPLATTHADALDLVSRAHAAGRVFCVTYNYSGYPLVRQARAMVAAGEIGEIRFVQLEYIQGHLATAVERTESYKRWKFDPQQTGPSLIVGDIGVHAYQLGTFVTGIEPAKLCADLGAIVPGREADDYASVMFRYANGARGTMLITQAAAGAEHGLKFRVHGEKGGLEWHQEQPNWLRFSPLGQPTQILTRRGPGLHPEANAGTRVSIGHPEGYHEAFANLYSEAAEAIVARKAGRNVDELRLPFPTVEDGARGTRFVDAVVESGRGGSTWVDCGLEL